MLYGWRMRFIPTYVGHTEMFHLLRNRMGGSSPHTWGIRAWGNDRAAIPRFIPTYVGHTRGTFPVCRGVAVHPHIRGAYFIMDEPIDFVDGSSPHTWGIRRAYPAYPCIRRFIPTYVGHTIMANIKKPTTRFIPTYVGHTPIAARLCYLKAVHPHIRGAYMGDEQGKNLYYGSSPHTWGIRIVGCVVVLIVAVHPHIRGAYTSERTKS